LLYFILFYLFFKNISLISYNSSIGIKIGFGIGVSSTIHVESKRFGESIVKNNLVPHFLLGWNKVDDVMVFQLIH
ncbi:Uncharacterized protein APZ42_001819, partial [Daphnia magna]